MGTILVEQNEAYNEILLEVDDIQLQIKLVE
jgi:hypothetical protein